jgi:flagella basal body P-ring formation protein FlgA
MRKICLCLGLLLVVGGPASRASTVAPGATRSVDVGDTLSLRYQLLTLADEHLRSSGLSVDRERARLVVLGAMPADGLMDVKLLGPEGAKVASLPVTFELRANGRGGAAGVPVRVAIVGPLWRDVWVANRRLDKGSAAACVDFAAQRRPAYPSLSWTLVLSCNMAAGAVALRNLGVGDLLREGDVGTAPAVTAGSAVRVKVQAASISVSTSAVALRDAVVGDRINVRLERPARIVPAYVTAPGLVQLTQEPL